MGEKFEGYPLHDVEESKEEPKKPEFEGYPLNEDPEVQMEDELSFEELVDIAEKSIAKLSVDSWKETYNKVIKVMVFAGAESKTIEVWQDGYAEWEEKFKGEEVETALEELKSLLGGALESSKRRGVAA